MKAPRWDLARLSKVEKNFYTPSPATHGRTDVRMSTHHGFIC